jgi:gamma-glutamylcyclotransferase (GGCT)/AIG2-like uncharacterized protein YtfP
MRLFVYGTLTDPACVERVTGRRFQGRPATLHGWARRIGQHGYPEIHPVAGAEVEGLILDEIDDAGLRALDAYEDEGRLYRRLPVSVAVEGGPIACDVYVSPASRLR